MVDNEKEIAIQMNGKTKATLMVSVDASQEEVLAAAKEKLGDKLTGNIIKEIYIPGRIVNIVAK